MCGRYSITIDKRTIEKRFGAKFYIAKASYAWSPTFNAVPSQMLPIRTYGPDRIELARWGFWTEEWKRNKHAYRMVNARLETAAAKLMFASSFHGRHCLVLANGYYGWRTIGKRKQPYRSTLKTVEAFAMAGIYAREPTQFETAEKSPVNSAIITTKANEAVSHIHERMPVILPLGREKSWLPLDPSGMFLFPRIPAELLTSYLVMPKMNRVSFNEADAITPLEPLTT